MLDDWVVMDTMDTCGALTRAGGRSGAACPCAGGACQVPPGAPSSRCCSRQAQPGTWCCSPPALTLSGFYRNGLLSGWD